MASQQRPLLFGLVSVTLLGSCGAAPGLRVSADVLDKITIENKLLLFDAENELNIAIDARDEIVDEIAQTKKDIKRTKQKRKVAARDEDVFSDKGDEERARVASLRARAASAQLEYLESRLSWTRERLRRERDRLVLARAHFELAKAKLVKKNNVPGASELDLEDFEAQVRDYAEDVHDADGNIRDAETTMRQREEAWVQVAKQLRDASGGALGSRWLE